jgi:peptidoglycan lytic transglycosylase F
MKYQKSKMYSISLICAASLALLLGCSSQSDLSVDSKPVEFDLAQIQERDTLRVITRNHPLTYYLYKGTRRGFDFELLQKFAEEQGMVLEVVLPPTWNDMIPYLLEGKGDVVASMMTVTDEREARVEFTRPYQEVWQVAVGRTEAQPPRTIEELEGRSVLVRESSSYDERLRALRDSTGISFEIVYHDELTESDDPIQMVANSRADVTIVDNTIAQLEQQFYPDLLIGASLTESQDIAWAVRPNAPELLTALNEFIERYDRSAFYNILKKRYFESPRRFRIHRTHQIALNQEGRISRYDPFFQSAEAEVGIDWRLLAAQAYHESRFYPEQVSWAGAVGLMQLMPETAQDVGVTDLYDPDQNIHGGARYLRQLLDIMEENLGENSSDFRNQVSFALAAYNAGLGHVFNARRLVREQNGNPDNWRDVATALILLEQPEYYRQDGYAFVRGAQVSQYVDDILNRYDIFSDIIDGIPVEDEVDDDAIVLTSL